MATDLPTATLAPADGPGPADGRTRWLRLAARIGAILLVIASVLFVALTLVHDHAEADKALGSANLWWLMPAIGIGAVAILYNAWRWGAAIEAVGGQRGPLSRLLSSYYVGELAKYVPGGIWSVVGRSEISRREGRSRAISYASVLLSLIAWYLAAAACALVLATISLGSGSVGTSWWPALIGATVVALVIVHPAVHGRLLKVAQKALRRRIQLDLPGWTACLRLSATYIPTWVGVAVATTIVAHALDPHESLVRVALATIVAWIVGFISPSPSGIGVREAVFVAASGLPAGPAAAVAVLARVMFVVIDLAGAMIGSWVLRTSPTVALGRSDPGK